MRREAEENVFLNYAQAVGSLGAIRSETGEATPGDMASGFPPLPPPPTFLFVTLFGLSRP